MAYIGNEPAENYASFLTQTFSVTATASYTLDHAVSNENDIRLVINNVVQQPGSGKAYTASGTTLTLSEATASTDVMYCVYLGRALQTVNPPNASVGTSQLVDGAVTSAKLASGAVANTPAFEAKMSADQTLSDDTLTKVNFNTEVFDTDGNYDHSSNYRFTPTTAGKYYVYSTVRCNSSSNSTVAQIDVIIYKNGSAYSSSGINFSTNYGNEQSPTVTNVIDFNGSSDFVEIYVRNNVTSGTPKVQADTFTSSSTFGAYKIIE